MVLDGLQIDFRFFLNLLSVLITRVTLFFGKAFCTELGDILGRELGIILGDNILGTSLGIALGIDTGLLLGNDVGKVF